MEKTVGLNRVGYSLLILFLGGFVSFTVPPVHQGEAVLPLSRTFEISCRNGTALEHRCAMEAAGAVETFYRDLGFAPVFREKLKIEFGEEIRLDGKTVDWVIGLYHRERRQIYICRLDSPVIRDNPRFAGLDKEGLYRSILSHEIAHHFNHCLCPGIFPTVDEAVAGFVQYSMMAPDLRKKMLNMDEATSFGSVRDFTIAAYINSPDGFLGGSYLYFCDHPMMLERILRGRAPLQKDPMFVEFEA